MQNISGGVGEAYPGSTGGEIFNYYSTDSNKNIASGNYSTAHGKKNSCTSTYAFAAGYNNTITNTIDNTAIALGGDNNVAGGIALGMHNTITGEGAFGAYLNNRFGNLTDGNRVRFVIGYGNKQTLLFPERSKNQPAPLVIGSGEVYQRENAIECYSNSGVADHSLVAFPTTICLSNKVIVNAITPPTDPSNPTIDEKTLATKSYVDSQVPSLAALQGITFKRTYTAVTGQITALTPGTDYNIETLFSITIPSWATHMKIGYDISSKQGYVYMHLGVVGNYPILLPDHDTSEMYSFILSWQPSTKELQLSYGYKWSAGFPAIDQNLGFSIMSIRFEGDYTPFPVTP